MTYRIDVTAPNRPAAYIASGATRTIITDKPARARKYDDRATAAVDKYRWEATAKQMALKWKFEINNWGT